jgi:6-pyruvoyl-tetrahydropterin synthase
MVMDLGALKRVGGDAVLARFDHADLNQDPLVAPGTIPTTENLVKAIWELLGPKLGPERLHRLRLWEDPTFYVEYLGE